MKNLVLVLTLGLTGIISESEISHVYAASEPSTTEKAQEKAAYLTNEAVEKTKKLKEKLKKNWHHLKDSAQKRWDKLTHEDLDKIKGKYKELSKKLQKRYHWTKDKAEEEINEFMEKHRED